MDCNELQFTRHAIQKMFERKISPGSIRNVAENGELIKSYPNDRPYPGYLLFLIEDKRPIHVVVAKPNNFGVCLVVTTYIPSELIWYSDFKTRKRKN